MKWRFASFRFSHGFWFWNPLIYFGLGNHLCDTLLGSTSSVQNLSSQDQNLRFIHLIWLFSRLYQGFPSKVQMNSHKCVLNLKLHWVTNSTYHSRSGPTSLQPTILVWCLPFPSTIPSHQSHQKLSTAILDYISTILHLSTINRRAGFIKNSSRRKRKRKKKTHWVMKWRFASFRFSSSHFHSRFSLWPYHFQHLATKIAS